MTGNLYEWLTDWNNSVPSGTFKNPWCGYNTSTTGTTVVRKDSDVLLKGGSYKRGFSYCTVQRNDYHDNPHLKDVSWGMRLCRNVAY